MREFDVYDLAASLGMSSEGGCGYVARSLELRYRLTRIWEQVVALRVPVWKVTASGVRHHSDVAR